MKPTNFVFDKKYNHQFYFLSKRAMEIKSSISGLILNNNKTTCDSSCNFDEKTNINFKKKDATSGLIDIDVEKLISLITIEFGSNVKYEHLKGLLTTTEALQIILVLLFKGYTWTNELASNLQISTDYKKRITNTLKNLTELGAVIKENGMKLSPYLFETIQKSEGINLQKSLNQAEICFITPRFLDFFEIIGSRLEYIVENNENVRHTLKSMVEHHKIFMKKYKKIMNEEFEVLPRKHQNDKGLIYYTEPYKLKNFKNELKKAVAEVKLETLENKANLNQLTESENKALIEMKNNPLALIEHLEKSTKNHSKVTYNGKSYTDEEFKELLRNQKEEDKLTEKAELEKGTSESKAAVEKAKHITDLREAFLFADEKEEESNFIWEGLGIKPKKVVSEEVTPMLEAICNKINHKGKVIYEDIMRTCGSQMVFDQFLELARNRGITTDLDYFYRGVAQ